MQPVVERFKQTYAQLSAQTLGLLSELYSDDVEFQDPFHQIAGLPALRQYFADLYAQAITLDPQFALAHARLSIVESRLAEGADGPNPGAKARRAASI